MQMTKHPRATQGLQRRLAFWLGGHCGRLAARSGKHYLKRRRGTKPGDELMCIDRHGQVAAVLLWQRQPVARIAIAIRRAQGGYMVEVRA